MRVAVAILTETKHPHEHVVSNETLKKGLEQDLRYVGWWDLASVTVGEHPCIDNRWRDAVKKPELARFREPLPIHTWSRCSVKGEWTLGEASGDFAIPGIHFIVVTSGLPFIMEKKKFFELYEVLE